MTLTIIMAAAVIVATIIGTIYLDKRENRRWKMKLHQDDLFVRIKDYGKDV